MSISEPLRKAARESGLSQYRLARNAGVDASIVCRFLESGRDLRLSTADRLAESLGLELRPRENRDGPFRISRRTRNTKSAGGAK